MGIAIDRITLSDFDSKLRALTASDPAARPFICDGSPLDCEVFIVGFNPASDVPFWPYWQLPYGSRKGEWEGQYRKIKGGYSQTRLRINRLVKALGTSIHCMETNIHAYPSPDAAGLPAVLRTTVVLQFLFDAVRPKVAFFHGKESSDFAGLTAVPRECRGLTGKHLRLWSYDAVDRLAEEIRGLAQSGASSGR